MLDVDIQSRRFLSAGGESLDAISGLQFSTVERSFTCIVGPSGCGKTTALRIILGLDKNYQGQVSMNGDGRVAAVFQEPCLLPWRTVRQNVELALPPELEGAELASLFDELGLGSMQDFFPSELSLGLARRVALARAFATEPALLILDEPFVSLDDDTATRLRRLLLSVWEARPTTVLMVTHNLREAVELADTVVLLANRPTHVIAEVPIDTPRGQRDARIIDAVVQQLDTIRQRDAETTDL
jgi:NitT/TauT family transport system ATP-binding protein